MSYIVQALRKLEQERRRVTVTEMTLFRGLSERWQSESLVWRYLLVLSLMVNTGLAVWLLFFSAVTEKDLRNLNPQIVEPSAQPRKETVAMPHKNHAIFPAPLKISLEVRPSQRVKTQIFEKDLSSGREIATLSRQRSIAKDDPHFQRSTELVSQKRLSADEIEMHESGAYSSPNIIIWKDENGNIHYSGTAGRN